MVAGQRREGRLASRDDPPTEFNSLKSTRPKGRTISRNLI